MHLKPDMESFKCEYCQSVYFPEKNDDGVRVFDDESGQYCPFCKLPLVHAVLAGHRIIYCKQCGGMLIAMQAFEDLIEAIKAESGTASVQPAADKKDLSRKMDCPACHRPMDTHFYAGPGNVVIDSCDTCCLIWLDRGELAHIAHAPDERATETAWE
jgi:Zn-finger nucleic acid-binding protein